MREPGLEHGVHTQDRAAGREQEQGGKGLSASRDATGTGHGPRHPQPHGGWWAAVHAALGGSAVDAVSEGILRAAWPFE